MLSKCLLSISIIMILSGCTSTWEKTKSTDTIEAYENYIENNHLSSTSKNINGNERLAEAKSRLKEHYFARACSINTIQAYEEYMLETGKHGISGCDEIVRTAFERRDPFFYLELLANIDCAESLLTSLAIFIREHDWNSAKSLHRPDAYRTFILRYPGSLEAEEAKTILSQLHERDWIATLNLDSPEGYSSFLRFYPTSEHSNIATARLSEILNEEDDLAELSGLSNLAGYYSKPPEIDPSIVGVMEHRSRGFFVSKNDIGRYYSKLIKSDETVLFPFGPDLPFLRGCSSINSRVLCIDLDIDDFHNLDWFVYGQYRMTTRLDDAFSSDESNRNNKSDNFISEREVLQKWIQSHTFSFELLARLLNDPSAGNKARLIRLIGFTGDPLGIAIIAKYIDDPDPDISEAAIDGLLLFPDESWVDFGIDAVDLFSNTSRNISRVLNTLDYFRRGTIDNYQVFRRIDAVMNIWKKFKSMGTPIDPDKLIGLADIRLARNSCFSVQIQNCSDDNSWISDKYLNLNNQENQKSGFDEYLFTLFNDNGIFHNDDNDSTDINILIKQKTFYTKSNIIRDVRVDRSTLTSFARKTGLRYEEAKQKYFRIANSSPSGRYSFYLIISTNNSELTVEYPKSGYYNISNVISDIDSIFTLARSN